MKFVNQCGEEDVVSIITTENLHNTIRFLERNSNQRIKRIDLLFYLSCTPRTDGKNFGQQLHDLFECKAQVTGIDGVTYFGGNDFTVATHKRIRSANNSGLEVSDVYDLHSPWRPQWHLYSVMTRTNQNFGLETFLNRGNDWPTSENSLLNSPKIQGTNSTMRGRFNKFFHNGYWDVYAS